MTSTPSPGHRKLAIVAAIVGTAASFVAIQAMVGESARLVDLVGLFAAAFIGGAGLVAAIRDRA